MANTQRGEVALVVNGVARPFVLTLGAMAAIVDEAGPDWFDTIDHMDGSGARAMAAAIAAGLAPRWRAEDGEPETPTSAWVMGLDHNQINKIEALRAIGEANNLAWFGQKTPPTKKEVDDAAARPTKPKPKQETPSAPPPSASASAPPNSGI